MGTVGAGERQDGETLAVSKLGPAWNWLNVCSVQYMSRTRKQGQWSLEEVGDYEVIRTILTYCQIRMILTYYQDRSFSSQKIKIKKDDPKMKQRSNYLPMLDLSFGFFFLFSSLQTYTYLKLYFIHPSLQVNRIEQGEVP